MSVQELASKSLNDPDLCGLSHLLLLVRLVTTDRSLSPRLPARFGVAISVLPGAAAVRSLPQQVSSSTSRPALSVALALVLDSPPFVASCLPAWCCTLAPFPASTLLPLSLNAP